MMLQTMRALLFAAIVGIVSGLLMALDPLLSVLNVAIPTWAWMVLTPGVIIFRLLMLFGPIALLSGGVASYRVTKRSSQRRSGVVVSGVIGFSLLIAMLVFFGTFFILLLQFPQLHQLLDVRASHFLDTLGLEPGATGQSPVRSPAVLVFGGIIACAFGLFNLLVALLSGICGSWLALRQGQPVAP